MQLLLFLLFPALELYLLVKVGGVIGALNMVLWVFVSAVVGLWAARAQGQGAMLKVRAGLNEGRVPQQSFLDGVLLFFGGVLLILPGLITDAVGIFLLLPPFRHGAAALLARYLATRQASGQASRVVFFRSVNFGGGPGFDSRFGHGETGTPRPESFDVHSEEPRQATIIESKVIDVESSGPEGAPDSSTDSGKPGGNRD